jgi:hypothetical protein
MRTVTDRHTGTRFRWNSVVYVSWVHELHADPVSAATDGARHLRHRADRCRSSSPDGA